MVFLIVYVKEAHSSDNPGSGNLAQAVAKVEQATGKEIAEAAGPQPEIARHQTFEDRSKAAHSCKAGLDLELPFVLDNMENTTGSTYGGFPDRIYVISNEGKIHYKGEPGPYGFNPVQAEESLKELLK